MKNKKLIGYAAAIFSTVLLGSMGVFVRNIPANGYIITFARLGFGLVFLTLYLLAKGEFKNIKKSQCSIFLLITGVLLSVTSLCYINAISSTTLSNAVFLLYLGPLIAVGLAAVVLKEKFTLFNGALLGLAFLGFLFLLEFKFSFNSSDSAGFLWGIASAFCYALYIVFNRKISQEIPSAIRSFYQLLVGVIVIVPFLDGSLFALSVKDMCWLVAIGFFHGFLAFTLVIVALKYLKAVQYGTISYIEPLVASLIGFALYAEKLSLYQLIGCAIVFIGGMILLFFSKKEVV